ncbi:MAG: pilus assembly protein TadG-related protein [Thiobacillus sp.]
MRRHQPKLPKRQRGAVAVVVGLTIFVLVGMIGLALDSGQLFVNKTELQNAADACALAAARELDSTADALTRADAAGVLVGTQNLVGFQDAAVALDVDDITYSEQLSPNSTYVNNADPAKAKFAMCQVERKDIGMWFMGVFGHNDLGKKPVVRAYAVATLAPSQTTCAIPIGMCRMPGGTAPTFGLEVGQWYSGKYSSGTPGVNGSFNWIDFDLNAGGANELMDSLVGPGQCELAPVGKCLKEQGQKGGVTDAWNTRFGIYKGAYKIADISTIPPDFSGLAYTKENLGGAIDTTWPNVAPENAYSGAPSFGTMENYQSAKASRRAYQSSTNPAGLKGGFDVASLSQLAQFGAQRRVALAPIVSCEDLGATGKSCTDPTGAYSNAVPLLGYACVLMLSPIEGPNDVVMEYLGQPNEPGSPCSSFGLAGGTAGPLVPVLVQ